MVKLPESTKDKIVTKFSLIQNKVMVAAICGTSARTVGRVLEERGIDKKTGKPLKPVKPVKPAKKLKTVVSAKPQPAPKPEPKESDVRWVSNASFLTIMTGGQRHSTDRSHPNFADAVAACEAGKFSEAIALIDPSAAIRRMILTEDIEIVNGELRFRDLPVESGLTKRIVELAEKHARGEDVFAQLQGHIKFFENLLENPSRKTVMRLYDFLVHNDIAITDDGYFIAWKRVQPDYTDWYTGRFDNTPGKRVEEPRWMVEEDETITCAKGLHVAAAPYIKVYATGRGPVISCKVHPRDVVAVPIDYDNAKMRTCGYNTVEDVSEEFKAKGFY